MYLARLLLWFGLVTLGVSPVLCAAARSEVADDRRDAHQAATMMAEQGWATVIEIDNTRPNRVYGRKVFATVFEFNEILWFYFPREGTQSLSLYRGRTAEDRDSLGELLREIHPGFGAFRTSVGPDEPVPATDGRWAPLRNGCLVESVHELRRLQARGMLLTEARLLMYYVREGVRRMGHTVLVYATPAGRFGWDPARPDADVPLRSEGWNTALQVARSLAPSRVSSRLEEARFLPVTSGEGAGRRYAGAVR